LSIPLEHDLNITEALVVDVDLIDLQATDDRARWNTGKIDGEGIEDTGLFLCSVGDGSIFCIVDGDPLDRATRSKDSIIIRSSTDAIHSKLVVAGVEILHRKDLIIGDAKSASIWDWGDFTFSVEHDIYITACVREEDVDPKVFASIMVKLVPVIVIVTNLSIFSGGREVFRLIAFVVVLS